MMWPLARQASAFTGRPFPEYARSQTPIRVVPSPVKTRGTRKAESES